MVRRLTTRRVIDPINYLTKLIISSISDGHHIYCVVTKSAGKETEENQSPHGSIR